MEVVLAIVLTAVATVATFGIAAVLVARMVRPIQKGVTTKALIALAILVLVWLPCMWIAGMAILWIHLPWGHAGALFFLVYIAVSIPMFGFASYFASARSSDAQESVP